MADDATSGTEPTADAQRSVLTRRWVGVGFAAFLVVLGAAYTIRAYGFGMTAERSLIGPGAAPVTLGILLVVGAAVILVGELRSLVWARRTPPAAPPAALAAVPTTAPPASDAAEPSMGAGTQLLRAVGVLALLAVGLGLGRIIGMIAGMTLAVMGIAFFVERLRPTRVLVLGAVTAVLLWLVFGQLLSVNFPPSLLGI